MLPGLRPTEAPPRLSRELPGIQDRTGRTGQKERRGKSKTANKAKLICTTGGSRKEGRPAPEKGKYMIHELKILPEYFEAVLSGEKTFEIRKCDRPFCKGDLLALNEYDPVHSIYTGKSCLVYVDYIFSNADYCKSGYVVMSIKPCNVFKTKKPLNPISLIEDYTVPLATEGRGEDGKG